MHTELDVLAERLVELVEVVLILGNLGEEVHALFDDVLADDFEDLVLLQGLTRDVERQVLGVDDTLDEVEVLGNKVLTVVHDEHAANIELDVVALLLLLTCLDIFPPINSLCCFLACLFISLKCL